MKKKYLQILRDIDAIKKLVEERNVTKEDETKLDELLERKKELEAKFKELENRAAEGTKARINFNIDPAEDKPEVTEDRFATIKYREAFRNYVLKGEKIPQEFRADATTLTSDIGSVIPTTIMARIISKLEDVGEIYNRITRVSYPGGLDIPVSNLKPVANWVAEGEVAETQKATTGKVSFSYYKLQVRIATSLIAATVSLDAFEGLLADKIVEAMIIAIEKSVISGTGNGQPLGIVNDTGVTNVVDFAADDATWNGWKTKLFTNIPLAYRKKRTAVILVNPGTYDKYMDGLVDDNGNPLARTNFGISGKEEYRFMGKEVILTDELPSLDEALAEEAFLAYVDLADYTFNSNMEITYKKYFDENTDTMVDKATLIGDGKLADKNGVVLLQKAAVAG